VVVVQRKQMLNEELRKLQNDVYGLEDEVYGNRKYGSPGLYGNLKACRQKLADKRLGGTGKLTRMEPIDRPTEKEKDFKVGIDEKGQLVAVSEEVLAERIERFKGYQKVLQDRRDQFEQAIDICDQDYKTALVNNGMNPADTKAEGEWVMDAQKGYRVWRAKRAPTDDPEELARRKALRERELSGEGSANDADKSDE
jgi:hypothetical protein